MANVFEKAMDRMELEPRPQQTKLVELARDAVREGRTRFIQAGTGTGKSYALLSLALELATDTGSPTLVVCPNNTLINQYTQKDAPAIAGATGGRFYYLKGRGRYLCANSRAARTQARGARVSQFRALTRGGQLEWAHHSLDEDWGCPGSDDCDSDNNTALVDGELVPVCGAQLAREEAKKHQVVVTNGHLLVWDQRVREFTGGSVELLPTPGAVMVDECHELDGIGRDCMSDEIGPKSRVYDAQPELVDWARQTKKRMHDAQQDEALINTDDELLARLATESQSEAERLLEEAAEVGVDPDLARAYRKEAKPHQRLAELVLEEDDRFLAIAVLEYEPDAPDDVDLAKLVLKRRCVDSSTIFRTVLGAQPSVLVSGTIPNTLPKRLGFEGKPQDVGTPFDYSKCTLAISPHSPKDRTHLAPRVDQLAGAIRTWTGEGKGGTLVLFTSWRELDLVKTMLAKRPDMRPLLDRFWVQEPGDPAQLAQDVQEFAEHGNGVLMGVRSLFTGLDIPGTALSQVVVWKLPYAVPTLEVKAIQAKFGRQVYYDGMLEVLTQGMGRLVRTKTDSGRVFIVDDRAKSIRWRANTMTAHVAQFRPHVRGA